MSDKNRQTLIWRGAHICRQHPISVAPNAHLRSVVRTPLPFLPKVVVWFGNMAVVGMDLGLGLDDIDIAGFAALCEPPLSQASGTPAVQDSLSPSLTPISPNDGSPTLDLGLAAPAKHMGASLHGASAHLQSPQATRRHKRHTFSVVLKASPDAGHAAATASHMHCVASPHARRHGEGCAPGGSVSLDTITFNFVATPCRQPPLIAQAAVTQAPSSASASASASASVSAVVTGGGSNSKAAGETKLVRRLLALHNQHRLRLAFRRVAVAARRRHAAAVLLQRNGKRLVATVRAARRTHAVQVAAAAPPPTALPEEPPVAPARPVAPPVAPAPPPPSAPLAPLAPSAPSVPSAPAVRRQSGRPRRVRFKARRRRRRAATPSSAPRPAAPPAPPAPQVSATGPIVPAAPAPPSSSSSSSSSLSSSSAIVRGVAPLDAVGSLRLSRSVTCPARVAAPVAASPACLSTVAAAATAPAAVTRTKRRRNRAPQVDDVTEDMAPACGAGMVMEHAHQRRECELVREESKTHSRGHLDDVGFYYCRHPRREEVGADSDTKQHDTLAQVLLHRSASEPSVHSRRSTPSSADPTSGACGAGGAGSLQETATMADSGAVASSHCGAPGVLHNEGKKNKKNKTKNKKKGLRRVKSALGKLFRRSRRTKSQAKSRCGVKSSNPRTPPKPKPKSSSRNALQRRHSSPALRSPIRECPVAEANVIAGMECIAALQSNGVSPATACRVTEMFFTTTAVRLEFENHPGMKGEDVLARVERLSEQVRALS